MEAETATEPPSSQASPLDWLRQIPGDLFKMDEVPLLGYPSPFPWDLMAKQIEHAFQIENLKLSPSEWQWRPKEELFASLGGELQTTALSVAPLSGTVYWAMPKAELVSLMKLLFAKGKSNLPQSIDPDFYLAFYRFLAAELIAAFEKAGFDKQLSPTLLPNDGQPSTHCLCLDVEIALPQGTSMHGRLLLSPEFRKSWAQRYQKQKTNTALNSPFADTLNVVIHLEAGRASLTPAEWKQIQVGDLLLLDACSIDPDEDKGRVMLVINDVPFFRGRIKQGSIKILEHPLYHEVDTNMTTPPPNKPEEGNNHEDENEDSFENSEFDDELSDEDTEGDETSETNSELEDDDFDISSEEIDVEEEETPAKPASASATPAPKATEAAAPTQPTQRPLSIEDVPLTVVVEAGRIQMSIKKILELQPGNMLDLNIHPETGVDLVINGRRVARGELLRIGDAIGVRIVELS